MIIKFGMVLKDYDTDMCFVVTDTRCDNVNTIGYDGAMYTFLVDDIAKKFKVYDSIMFAMAPESHLNTQHGGDHYKKLGDYQPWQVLKTWLTEEEFCGYMKGTAIAYLAREKDKGGDLDIKKATHTLQALLEMMENERV
jgi:hypothetical protein